MKTHPLTTAFRWLASHELGVLVAFAIVIGGSWAFIELADEVAEGELQAFDERVLLAMRDGSDPAKPWGPPWFVETARDVTALGGYFFLCFVTFSVALYLCTERKFHAMGFLLGAVIGGYIVMRILKLAFGRPRPDIVPHLSAALHQSFPSGHSMMSAVVFLTLGVLLSRLETTWRLKVYFLLLALFVTFIVGISRVYMGVHYPTDVLAGWACGFVWAAVCSLVARYLQSRGQLEQEM
jgi:undecaprenyl-diphosphatase